MVTFNHGFSAFICGRVAMPLLKRRAPISERALGWAFFLGGMMPDADYLSKLFGRTAYFSGDWFAHRGASHSILGTLLMAAVLAAVLFRPLTGMRLFKAPRAYLWLAGCGWAGGLIHIFGDLFTPGLPVPLLWPSEERFGAFSHIGWFSPYLFWFFLTTLLIAWVLSRLARWLGGGSPWRNGAARWHEPAVWLLFTVATWRWVQFVLVSRYDSHQQWAEYQRSLLPDPLVNGVTRGVGYLWYWLTG